MTYQSIIHCVNFPLLLVTKQARWLASSCGCPDRRREPAMSFRSAPYPAQPAPADSRDLLFTPGPRLGWVFRDRRELVAPYPEPGPSPQLFHERAAAELASAEQSLARAWRW